MAELRRLLRDVVSRHYTINWVESDGMAFLRDYFGDDDTDWTLNWLFVGTSGVHGSYMPLDTAAMYWTDPNAWAAQNYCEEGEEPPMPEVTFTVFCPRMVRVYYGNAECRSLEDVEWLRETVGKSMEGIAKLQELSLPEGMEVSRG